MTTKLHGLLFDYATITKGAFTPISSRLKPGAFNHQVGVCTVCM